MPKSRLSHRERKAMIDDLVPMREYHRERAKTLAEEADDDISERCVEAHLRHAENLDALIETLGGE